MVVTPRFVRPLLLIVCLLAPSRAAGPVELRRMQLEHLLEVEVTTAARKPQPLYRSASAIFLLRPEDIARSGSTSIADALRLVPGLFVGQVNGRTWSVGSRGFNTVAGNKLEVVFDGRSVYTPFFSGVYWDTQDTLLQDLDRVEVVRGPGGTLWGANAVNGVISISTAPAWATQGTLVSVLAGSTEQAQVGVRHGWRVGDDAHARVYLKYFNREWTLRDGRLAQEDHELLRMGFRLDRGVESRGQLTLLGEGFSDRHGVDDRSGTVAEGGNLLARWTRSEAEGGSTELQGWYDRTVRDIPGIYGERRHTGEVSLKQRRLVGERHDVVWGLQARAARDVASNVGSFLMNPAARTVHLLGAYVQDEIALVPETVGVALGTKVEHNSFSGFELQPSLRASWQLGDRETLWGAVSRAVRTPSRIDRDFYARNSERVTFQASSDFDSENLIAYELGYRRLVNETLSLDLAVYYNKYDDLRSLETLRDDDGRAVLTFGNFYSGATWGGEAAVDWQANSWLRARASYTHFQDALSAEPGSSDRTQGVGLGNDPRHLAALHLSADLSRGWELDAIARYVGALPSPRIPSYVAADLRLGYQPSSRLEVSVVGRNLLDPSHPEFRGTGALEEVRRSFFVEGVFRF